MLEPPLLCMVHIEVSLCCLNDCFLQEFTQCLPIELAFVDLDESRPSCTEAGEDMAARSEDDAVMSVEGIEAFSVRSMDPLLTLAPFTFACLLVAPDGAPTARPSNFCSRERRKGDVSSGNSGRRVTQCVGQGR